MVLLLARCGDIMTNINKILFKFLKTYLCSKMPQKYVLPDSLLSALSLFILFICYLHVIFFFDIRAGFDLNYLDSIYFWFVTFTTIGFGDITYDVSDWEYSLMVYRLFGLALLAGVIDSIVVWLKERRKKLKKLRKFMAEKKELLQDGAFISSIKDKATEFKKKTQTQLNNFNSSFNRNAKETEDGTSTNNNSSANSEHAVSTVNAPENTDDAGSLSKDSLKIKGSLGFQHQDVDIYMNAGTEGSYRKLTQITQRSYDQEITQRSYGN